MATIARKRKAVGSVDGPKKKSRLEEHLLQSEEDEEDDDEYRNEDDEFSDESNSQPVDTPITPFSPEEVSIGIEDHQMHIRRMYQDLQPPCKIGISSTITQ